MTEPYEKYPSAARSEIHSTLIPTLIVMCVGAVLLVVDGLFQQRGLARVFEVGMGILLLLVARGLYRFRPWARWTTVAVMSTLTVAALVSLWLDGQLFTMEAFVHGIVAFVLWGSILLYLITAGKEFALANSEWKPRSAKGLAALAAERADAGSSDELRDPQSQQPA